MMMMSEPNVACLETLPKPSQLPQARQMDAAAITDAHAQPYRQVGVNHCRQLCSSSRTAAITFALRARARIAQIYSTKKES